MTFTHLVIDHVVNENSKVVKVGDAIFAAQYFIALCTAEITNLLNSNPVWFAWGEAFARAPSKDEFALFGVNELALFTFACLGYRNLGIPGITPVGIWVASTLGREDAPQFFDFRIQPDLAVLIRGASLEQNKARARGTWFPTQGGGTNKMRIRLPHK